MAKEGLFVMRRAGRSMGPAGVGGGGGGGLHVGLWINAGRVCH